jgi:thiol-disulfide isomerase/thioredoxin
MHRGPSARGVVLALAFALALVPAAASAANWRPFPGLRLLVDSTLDPGAHIFYAEGGLLLAMPSSGDWEYVIWVKDGRGEAIKRSKVQMSGDLPALDPTKIDGEPVAEYRKSGADVHLKYGGHEIWLTPQPPLVGDVSLDQILLQKPEFKESAAEYAPNAEAVRFLASVKDSVQLVVFFGSWCPVCAEEVPKLIKTVDSAGNGRIQVRFIGVSEDLKEPHEALKKFSVSATPSLLVIQNGRELGRIVEHPEDTIEGDLVSIIKRGRS